MLSLSSTFIIVFRFSFSHQSIYVPSNFLPSSPHRATLSLKKYSLYSRHNRFLSVLFFFIFHYSIFKQLLPSYSFSSFALFLFIDQSPSTLIHNYTLSCSHLFLLSLFYPSISLFFLHSCRVHIKSKRYHSLLLPPHNLIFPLSL